MIEEETFYLLALQKVSLIGDINAKKLLYHFSSAKNIFGAKPHLLNKIDGIGSAIIKNLQDKKVFQLAEKEYNYILKNNLKIHAYNDDSYPERLKHCPDNPILMFSSGNIDFNNRKIISIVGTRKITHYGTDICNKLITDIAPLNPIIVSGFAYGVDIVAHKAAIENNLQTIGILAHGLDTIYPSAHKKHVAKIESNGGFMTEFWSGSKPDRENFVKRNRIVAGISEATIVIESANKGGSLITANLANDYNRDVFAVPGRTTDTYSQGCNTLIKTQKAHLLNGAEDLIYILNWNIYEKPKPVQKQLFVNLDDNEQKIFDFLSANGKELLDIISLKCGLSIHNTSSTLLNMELKGVIRPLPGKLFEII